MKMRHISALILLITLAFLLNVSCKSTPDVTELIFTVVLYEGVSGTPSGGTYYYEDGDQVVYDYTLLNGYIDLVVTLDNTEIASQGNITVSDNHTLKVSATKQASAGGFELTVSRGTGVTGNPESGVYTHQSNDQVDYNYQLENGYTNLIVALDGNEIANSGTITITQNHTLTATAIKEYPILGSWTLEENYNDGSSFAVTATFTGNTSDGTVIDSQGGIGTYSIEGAIIEFTIQHPEVRYEYIGSFSSDNTMNGTSKRYIGENNSVVGVWTARKDSVL